MAQSAVVVGGGAFGLSSALALVDHGWRVTVVDPGPIPHPLAASTDISKIIRADYGADALYVDLMEEAFPRWRALNAQWSADLYHETGFLILAAGPLTAGSYEHASFSTLDARGFPLDRLTEVGSRFPAWDVPPGVEAYVNRRAGWAESGAVVARLAADAADQGVHLRTTRAIELLTNGTVVEGVATADGDRLTGDLTVVAAGAWTTELVPDLAPLITTTGHPIMHFVPDDPDRFRPPHFLPWAADISNTGWYGFPVSASGVIKVANHGTGRQLDPDHPRQVAEIWEPKFRAFLTEWLPALASLPIAEARLCVYTDTIDGDFLIDRHPDLEGLVVATGGSGHGFKFAPIIGDLVLEAVAGAPRHPRFAWRVHSDERKEPARAVGSG